MREIREKSMTHASPVVEELLILNQQPMSEQRILGWRPFQQGSSLGDILDDYHQGCREAIGDNTPAKYVRCAQDQVTQLRVIQARPCAADPPGTESVTPALDLKRTKIILLDWDSLSKCQDFLIQHLNSGNEQKHFTHLILLGHQLSPDYAELFLESFLTTRLDICRNQHDLERIFRRYYETLGYAWWGVSRNPFTTPCQSSLYGDPLVHPRHSHFVDSRCSEGEIIRRVYQNYQEIVPELVVRIRDHALLNELRSKQVRYLGRLAAIQEFLILLAVEQTCIQSETVISTKAIRRPLTDIPIENPFDLKQLRETELLLLELDASQRQPTNVETEFLADLGLTGSTTAAILVNKSEVWEKIAALSEITTVKPFRASLPKWEREAMVDMVGLNEATFGINIEESFSRSLEVNSDLN